MKLHPHNPRVVSRRQFAGLSMAAAAAAAAALPGARALAATVSHLTLQTAWVYDAESIGYLVAKELGYYAAEGVDLTVLSGGPDVIPESTLLAGRADIALTSADTCIKAIAERGAKFRIIAAQFQKSPIGVVSLSTRPIRTPGDLVGKILAVPPVNMVTVQAFLRINGIDKRAVRIVPYQFDPTPLLKGEIDASVDFVTDVPYTIQLAGKQAVSFLLYDYGVPLFNNTVVVSEQLLATSRSQLVRWLRASRRGWQENFRDPARYPHQFRDSWFKGTGRDTGNEIFSNRANQPLMECPQGLLSMTEEAIQKQISFFQSLGIRATRQMYDGTLLAEL